MQQLPAFLFGESARKLPILSYEFGSEGPRVLVLGGVHGDEIEGIWTTLRLQALLVHHPIENLRLTLVPIFNPDGAFDKVRGNAHGVDLNRNLPTKDWSPHIATPRYHPGPHALSEPENICLMAWIDRNKPAWILSLHSWQPCLNTNGDCEEEARVMSQITGYEITHNIGYPTPGSLGSLGLERNIPVLTYEVERGLPAEKVLAVHPEACMAGLRHFAQRNLHKRRRNS